MSMLAFPSVLTCSKGEVSISQQNHTRLYAHYLDMNKIQTSCIRTYTIGVQDSTIDLNVKSYWICTVHLNIQ